MTIIAGIAGGSGGGKTTLAAALEEHFKPKILRIECDWYYRPQDALTLEQRALTNYDHPDAVESGLLAAHLRRLASGECVEAPVYDFALHTRRPETRRLTPHPILLVEGIHALHYPELRAMYAWKVFVEAPADIRFIRRLQRDMLERGRTAESVVQQYLAQVRPMHEQFVEPVRAYADIIVSGENLEASLEQVIATASAQTPR